MAITIVKSTCDEGVDLKCFHVLAVKAAFSCPNKLEFDVSNYFIIHTLIFPT